MNRYLDKMHSKIESNPNFIPNQSWSSINVAYLKTRLTPKTKYQIWRNATNSHLKYTVRKNELIPTCSTCECPAELYHYVHECPQLDEQRYYCQNRISEILNRPECSLSSIQDNPIYNNVLYFHHSGTTFFENEFIKHIPYHKLKEKWPEIQAIISKFIGRSFIAYQIDAKPTKRKTSRESE